MIVSTETLALIKAGRKNTITVSGNYKPGRCYAIQTSHAEPAQAHITVIAIKHISGTTLKLRFILGDHTDQPRLLKARPGGHEGDYTNNPTRAMKAEPEAVSADTLDTYVLVSRERHENGLQSHRERWAKEIASVRYEMVAEGAGMPKAAKLLKTVEQELRKCYALPQREGT